MVFAGVLSAKDCEVEASSWIFWWALNAVSGIPKEGAEETASYTRECEDEMEGLEGGTFQLVATSKGPQQPAELEGMRRGPCLWAPAGSPALPTPWFQFRASFWTCGLQNGGRISVNLNQHVCGDLSQSHRKLVQTPLFASCRVHAGRVPGGLLAPSGGASSGCTPAGKQNPFHGVSRWGAHTCSSPPPGSVADKIESKVHLCGYIVQCTENLAIYTSIR